MDALHRAFGPAAVSRAAGLPAIEESTRPTGEATATSAGRTRENSMSLRGSIALAAAPEDRL